MSMWPADPAGIEPYKSKLPVMRRSVAALFVFVLMVALCQNASAKNVITTFPGAHPPTLIAPHHIVVDTRPGLANDGAILVSDVVRRVIVRIDRNGNSRVVAGNGKPCEEPAAGCGDGGRPEDAQLSTPTGISVTRDGELLIADRGAHRVRIISKDRERITTFAGSGEKGGEGDSGPADLARLNAPQALLQLDDGRVLIADKSGIREVAATDDRTIRTLAGRGNLRPSMDPLPATAVKVCAAALASSADGGMLIADFHGHCILKLKDDRLWVVAGEYGIETDFCDVCDVVECPDRSLLVTSSQRHLLRRVATDGVITPVAGLGTEGFNGDNIPACLASLGSPCGICLTSEGVLVASGSLIRVITEVEGNEQFDGIVDALPAVNMVNPDSIVSLASGQDVLPLEQIPSAIQSPTPFILMLAAYNLGRVPEVTIYGEEVPCGRSFTSHIPLTDLRWVLVDTSDRFVIEGHILDIRQDYYLKPTENSPDPKRKNASPGLFDLLPPAVRVQIWSYVREWYEGDRYFSVWKAILRYLLSSERPVGLRGPPQSINNYLMDLSRYFISSVPEPDVRKAAPLLTYIDHYIRRYIVEHPPVHHKLSELEAGLGLLEL